MRWRWPVLVDDYLTDNGKEWFLHLLNKCSEDVRDMIIMLTWRIWQLRNDKTHGKDIPPVLPTVEFLDSYYKSVKLAGRYSEEEILKGKMSPLTFARPSEKKLISPAPWPAPAVGTVALSVDGSFQEANGSTAAGMVLRNNDGSIIFAAYRFIFRCNDPLEAELHAIMQGVALAIQHSNLLVVLQSDSSEALSRLSNEALVRYAYLPVSS
ncbi:uncharacterized protein [Aegilops tauschii subsp. strangulata]|uniref:uncharacterized protein n=1 Tax=Aegilops tauschii subsp. strangulata TaxID=200361 RepID=UPI001E204C09